MRSPVDPFPARPLAAGLGRALTPGEEASAQEIRSLLGLFSALQSQSPPEALRAASQPLAGTSFAPLAAMALTLGLAASLGWEEAVREAAGETPVDPAAVRAKILRTFPFEEAGVVFLRPAEAATNKIPLVPPPPTRESLALAGRFRECSLLSSSAEAPRSCPKDRLLAHYCAARRDRPGNKTAFVRHQEALVHLLQQSSPRCSPGEPFLGEQTFGAFRLEAALWQARGRWHLGDLEGSLASGKAALALASDLRDPRLSLETLQVLVGRTGYELLPPKENLSLLTKSASSLRLGPKGREWMQQRRGLLLFEAKEYAAAQDAFKTLGGAAGAYWLGRTLAAAGDDDGAEEAFLEAGRLDPMGTYDALAGIPLGLHFASVDGNGPVGPTWDLPWEAALPLAPNIASALSQEGPCATPALLGIAQLQRPGDPLLKSLLTYSIAQCAPQATDPGRTTVLAWLEGIQGKFHRQILTAGSAKPLLPQTPLLLGALYPRPYRQAYGKASQLCQIPLAHLYAISRQESLFQSAVRSPAGAVGLMQLMPSTAKQTLSRLPGEVTPESPLDLTQVDWNTLLGACTLSFELERQGGEFLLASMAYNAGNSALESWKKNRFRGDLPLFLEWVPYGETKSYAQLTLRNLHAYRWIYGDPLEDLSAKDTASGPS